MINVEKINLRISLIDFIRNAVYLIDDTKLVHIASQIAKLDDDYTWVKINELYKILRETN